MTTTMAAANKKKKMEKENIYALEMKMSSRQPSECKINTSTFANTHLIGSCTILSGSRSTEFSSSTVLVHCKWPCAHLDQSIFLVFVLKFNWLMTVVMFHRTLERITLRFLFISSETVKLLHFIKKKKKR